MYHIKTHEPKMKLPHAHQEGMIFVGLVLLYECNRCTFEPYDSKRMRLDSQALLKLHCPEVAPLANAPPHHVILHVQLTGLDEGKMNSVAISHSP